ncbi:hypothetical protein [Micromonospora echinospora]|uniref:hypothetical protein n=1 Tax=Micromonospora echinospora TaxID=1877 RepID=UPI003A8BE151
MSEELRGDVSGPGLPGWIRKFFSDARLEPYLRAAKGDAVLAERLYWWDDQISQAFHHPLKSVELAVRNALHERLRLRYGRADWWAAAPLRENSVRLVEDARQSYRLRARRAPGADDIVAQLSFGFWVALISTSYDRHLWVPTLHRAFPHYRGRRGDLYQSLNTVRLLRNRIGHHEPIHYRDLVADHARIYRLLDYLDPELSAGVRVRDEVPMVLARRPVLS